MTVIGPVSAESRATNHSARPALQTVPAGRAACADQQLAGRPAMTSYDVKREAGRDAGGWRPAATRAPARLARPGHAQTPSDCYSWQAQGTADTLMAARFLNNSLLPMSIIILLDSVRSMLPTSWRLLDDCRCLLIADYLSLYTAHRLFYVPHIKVLLFLQQKERVN